ncbi:uncharacterized protein LOC117590786 [Drosophila guanche]|uniref:Uncharacterized protein n=1 Tax=Drosophila guanche TaxID=7266 RepID=A0A3B0K4J2_DROGU|nr:uncharacterized protein LOC117590786 [Drosophila guanche]SPP89147.1 Hypothetical predicted protein [Drosophila guanche]
MSNNQHQIDFKLEVGEISSLTNDIATPASKGKDLTVGDATPASKGTNLTVGDSTPGSEGKDLTVGDATPVCKSAEPNASMNATAGNLGLASSTNEDATMGASSHVASARKLIFHGCCKLTDEELSERYKLNETTDEELASVGLNRQEFIDSYRVMDEISILHGEPQLLKKKPESDPEAKPLKHFLLKYRFPLLNALVVLLSTDDKLFRTFMQRDLPTDYPLHLPTYRDYLPEERKINLFIGFCRHLDSLYLGPRRLEALKKVSTYIFAFRQREFAARACSNFS